MYLSRRPHQSGEDRHFRQGALSISAYPEELEETVTLRDKAKSSAYLRPVRPDDATALKAMLDKLTPSDRYQRFMGNIPSLTSAQISRLSHIDYDREMVFVAVPAPGMLHSRQRNVWLPALHHERGQRRS